jgi:hypothetical protein
MYRVLGLIALFAFLAVLPFTLKFHQQDFMIFLLINVLAVASYRLMTLTGEWSLCERLVGKKGRPVILGHDAISRDNLCPDRLYPQLSPLSDETILFPHWLVCGR